MMLPKELREYDQIIVWDFEFANIGGAIYPTSLAYKNILEPKSKIKFLWLRDWQGKVVKKDIPFDREDNILFVSFFGEAEWSCFKELGWERDKNTVHIDLFPEIKILKNGLWSAFSLGEVAKKLGFKAEYLEDDKTNLRERLGND